MILAYSTLLRPNWPPMDASSGSSTAAASGRGWSASRIQPSGPPAPVRATDVPTAASAGISSVHEAVEFVEAVGFPVILKPRAAAGASGTYRADNGDELAAAARVSGLADGAPVAIEEFVVGHEGFYDTLTVNGQVTHDFVSHYYPNVLEAMRTRWISPQIVATNRVHEPGYDEVKEMGRRVATALGIGTPGSSTSRPQ